MVEEKIAPKDLKIEKKIKLFSVSMTTDFYPPGLRFMDKIIPRQIPYQAFKLWGWFLGWDKVKKI